MELDKAVTEVVNRIETRRCLPFIGAGVSVWENFPEPQNWTERALEEAQMDDVGVAVAKVLQWGGCRGCDSHTLPGAPATWVLTACMLLALDRNERSKAVNDDRPLSTVAQFLYEHKPRFLAHLLHHFFGWDSVLPNNVHRLLALLPFNVVVTTNFDRCFEHAWEDMRGSTLQVRLSDEDLLWHGLGAGVPMLIKLHGDFRDFKFSPDINRAKAQDFINDHAVLTNEQYWCFPGGGAHLRGRSAVPRRLLVEYLRVLMATHLTLFLGYRMADFNIIEVLHGISELSGGVDKPIVVLDNPQPAEIALLESRRFEVVPCQVGEFIGSVVKKFCFSDQGDNEFLESLTSRMHDPRSRFARDRFWDIPVMILMEQAVRVDGVRDSLKQACFRRCFPAELLGNAGSEWIRRFLAMDWLRQVNRENPQQTVFYEFDVEVRLRLAERLRLRY